MGLGAATSLHQLQLLIFNHSGVKLHFKANCLSLECNVVAVEQNRQRSPRQASIRTGRGCRCRPADFPAALPGEGKRRAAPAHAGTAGLGEPSPEHSRGLRHPAAEGCWPRPAPAQPGWGGRSRCGSATSRRPPRPYSCVWERRLEGKLLTGFIWLFPWLGIYYFFFFHVER